MRMQPTKPTHFAGRLAARAAELSGPGKRHEPFHLLCRISSNVRLPGKARCRQSPTLTTQKPPEISPCRAKSIREVLGCDPRVSTSACRGTARKDLPSPNYACPARPLHSGKLLESRHSFQNPAEALLEAHQIHPCTWDACRPRDTRLQRHGILFTIAATAHVGMLSQAA